MNRLRSLMRFGWDFLIGDDWRIALAVVVGVSVVALVGTSGWFVLPLVVLATLTLSVAGVARNSTRRSH